MIILKLRKKYSVQISRMLFVCLLYQLIFPISTFALTSGPSQPEMQSFEPVGTTDMVDLFSGDFNYNIPLLDVEGYPINIAYHSGIGMEQEASWVGLGWNINPGNINHVIRGISDDYNGEFMEKEIDINPEIKKRYQFGLGAEYAGAPANLTEKFGKALKVNAGGSINFGITISNYTGVSADFRMGTSASFSNSWFSGGLNMGATVNTASGVDVDYNFTAGAKATAVVTTSVNGSFGQGFNSREGLKYTSFGVNPSISFSQTNLKDATKPPTKDNTKSSASQNYSLPGELNTSFVPISLQNFVPVITNASFMNSTFTQIKLGAEIYSILPHITGAIGEDKLQFEKNGSVKSYGYLNMHNATKDDMVDFSRDRDGRFSRLMKNLAPASMTYDIFAVNGQGTAGNFRPFRNDIGYVYDPLISSDSKSVSNLFEAGIGNIAEAGWDRVKSTSTSTSRPWEAFFVNNTINSGFRPRAKNDNFEPYYFKQAGELTESSKSFKDNIIGYSPLLTHMIPNVAGSSPGVDRTKRSNLFYYFNAEEASNKNVSLQPKLETYTQPGFPGSSVKLNRTNHYRRANHISEVTQLLPDGRRYIFGIPAMNKSQYEYVVSCNAPNVNDGIADCDTFAANGTPEFGQKFKMRTKTPAFAHSYLLTNILSPDYSDLTGDGISDDDLGTYTKFNYTLKDTNYKWRTPYYDGTGQPKGQFDIGVKSDCQDDKATFIMGSKEIWILHSVESKNFVAEFYTSPRADGLGADGQNIVLGNSVNKSYKLDSIVLFNKIDRKVNTNSAVPIKKVIFSYDYSLCIGASNSASGFGKLTLKAISIKYGGSDVGLLSPYKFEYNSFNPNYNQTCKDTWGNYKPVAGNEIASSHLDLSLTNHEFPYVNQTDLNLDNYASAWNLKKIHLPSGGTINLTYEADDYAKVQDKHAMEMFQVKGVGLSTDFVENNTLYQSPTVPYLYIYFKRKTEELFPNDIPKSYLADNTIIQYNFDVEISPDKTTESCDIPLRDNIKGYATVKESGICSGQGNDIYGYIKLEPKEASTTAQLKALNIGDIKINPITLTAINYAKYYNNKSLYPSSDMVQASAGEVISNLLQTGTEITDYLVNPLRKFIKQGKAKNFDISKSYIRLNSQARKYGGGHRVKRIEFIDSWNGIANATDASYGSDYEYETTDVANGKIISSGVASYEPLFGGNENPYKRPLSVDMVGKSRKFPVVDPIELTNEGPVGETMYPSASVGYSKVTVKSIHKNTGESSQMVQEHEFFTAYDFPVKVTEKPIDILEDVKSKRLSFKAKKKEIYRVAQNYTLEFNDMHGKLKMQKTLNKDGACVSYKKYEYFADNDKTLNNNVKCLSFVDANNQASLTPVVLTKELGVEVDLTLDSREREEKSDTKGFCVNLNTFLIGPIPVPLPSAFPKRPKSLTKIFSSIVSTKVIQRYGILKSVETFDKGATVKLSNDVFDPTTGQVLITHVNTEHNDVEYNAKFPAYWTYTGMGPAYENIQYEETISENASIVNDTMYIYPTINNDNLKNYRIGDELLIDIKNSCKLGDHSSESYKLWVVGKTNEKTPKVKEAVIDQCFPDASCGPKVYNPALPMQDKVEYLTKMYHLIGNSTSISKGCDHLENILSYIKGRIMDDDLINFLSASPPEYLVEENLPHPGTKIDFTSSIPINNCTKINYEVDDNTSGYIAGSPVTVVDKLKFDWGSSLMTARYCTNNTYHNEYATCSNASPAHAIGGAPHKYNIIKAKKLPNYNLTPAIHTSPYLLRYDIKAYYTNREYIVNAAQALASTNGFYWIMTRLASSNQGNIFKDYFELFRTYLASTPDLNYNAYVNNIVTDQNHLLLGSGVQNHPFFKFTIYIPWGNPDLTGLNNNLSSSAINSYKYFAENSEGGILVYDGAVKKGHLTSLEIGNNTFILENRVNEITVERSAPVVVKRNNVTYDYYDESALICLPHKRNAKSSTGTLASFPTDDSIISATVKIIRSGNRNQLGESVQEVATLQNPISSNVLNVSSDKVLSASARTYTHQSYAPTELGNADTKYHNPIVTGLMWNYRPMQEYVIHAARNYINYIDKNKGKFSLTSFLTFIPKIVHQYLNHASPSGNANGWYAKTNVDIYNSAGNDLQVRDASGSFHSNIFGYGNRLPVAIVSNSKWNNSISENFEDCSLEENRFIHDNFYSPDFIIKNFQNTLKEKVVLDNTNFDIASTYKHSGTKSLEIKTNAAVVNFDIKDDVSIINPNNYKLLESFFFRPQQKYLMSFWKKVENNQTPGFYSGINLSMGGTTFNFKVKTPAINGWAKYEGEFTVPINATTAQLTFPNGAFFDDFRLIPFTANMKSYVYHPVNRRLVAVLDENNMSTIFEYNPEGKLARLKKETEKGVLTLKESRDALRHITIGPGTIHLVDVNAYLPTGIIPQAPYTPGAQ